MYVILFGYFQLTLLHVTEIFSEMTKIFRTYWLKHMDKTKPNNGDLLGLFLRWG